MEVVLDYLKKNRPDAAIDAMCAGPDRLADEYGIPAIPLYWQPKHQSDSRRLIALLGKVIAKVVDAGRIAAWVRRHDVVIIPGMGVLEATLPLRPWHTPYAMFSLCASGRLFGTKVALVSVGANTINRRVTRWLLNWAARLAYYRSYRDDLSRDAMTHRWRLCSTI